MTVRASVLSAPPDFCDLEASYYPLSFQRLEKQKHKDNN